MLACSQSEHPARWIIAAIVAALPALPATASATVITVAPDGQVTRYEAPKRAILSPAEPTLPPTPLPSSGQAVAATAADLDATLIAAVAWIESRNDPTARSAAGALGAMQLMPATARDLGVDPYDPDQNLRGGASYLRLLIDRYHGDLVLALAAYNAGPGAVDRHRGVPPYPETRHYVGAVLARLAATLPIEETAR